MKRQKKIFITEILQSSSSSSSSESSESEHEDSCGNPLKTNQSLLSVMKMFIDYRAQKKKRRRKVN